MRSATSSLVTQSYGISMHEPPVWLASRQWWLAAGWGGLYAFPPAP